jgi:hypothetical protein
MIGVHLTTVGQSFVPVRVVPDTIVELILPTGVQLRMPPGETVVKRKGRGFIVRSGPCQNEIQEA